MKLIVLIFIIITLFCNFHNSNSTIHWMEYIQKSISFNLDNHKSTLLDILSDLKTRYRHIWDICYVQSFIDCGGTLKGLCGSIEVTTNRLMDCLWELQVPHNLCINVTIDKFPNGDPFVNDYFLLSVKDKNKTSYTDGINFHLNQLSTNVMTNTSQSLIKLQIKKFFMVSSFALDFQAVPCNVTVTYNTITVINQGGNIYYERKHVMIATSNSERSNTLFLSVRTTETSTTVSYNTNEDVISVRPSSMSMSALMPYSYSPRHDNVEYHFLLRTVSLSYVRVIFLCTDRLTLYDGPSSRAQELDLNCQSDKIANITASSFQAYIVFKYYFKDLKQRHLNFTFEGVFVRLRTEMFDLDGSTDVTFSWDFTNTSKLIYMNTQFFYEHSYIEYRMLPSYQEESPHGFLCQFHGIIARYNFIVAEEAFYIGPFCTQSQMLMLKNESFTSLDRYVEISTYSYGSTQAKGSIIFPRIFKRNICLVAVNPCRICSLPLDLFYAYTTTIRLSMKTELICTHEGIPVFQVGTGCMSVTLVSSYLSVTEQSCKFQFISSRPTNLKYTLVHKKINTSEKLCNVEVPDMKYSEEAFTYKKDIKLEKYNHQFESRSHQFEINSDCFINNFVSVLVETIPKEASDCETVNLSPVTDMNNFPKFDGTCFIFSLTLSVEFYAFDVTFLNVLSIKEYQNQLAVGVYLEKPINKMLLSKDQLELLILDKKYGSNTFHTYTFNVEEMPFSWQSYGQYLTIQVNASYKYKEPFSMWIIVNAIFESFTLYSYLIQPYDAVLDSSCYRSNGLSIGYKTCFSIHADFHGSWIESQEVCKKQGASLWLAKSSFEWAEVMRSAFNNWYLEDYSSGPVNFDGRINAVALLPSSSVMYLGKVQPKNEVMHMFPRYSLCFIIS